MHFGATESPTLLLILVLAAAETLFLVRLDKVEVEVAEEEVVGLGLLFLLEIE